MMERFILVKLIGRKGQELVFVSIERVNFTKDSLQIMTGLVAELKSIQMEIFILDNS